MTEHELSFRQFCENLQKELSEMNWDAEMYTISFQTLHATNIRGITMEEWYRLREVLMKPVNSLPEGLTESKKVDLVIDVIERNYRKSTDIEGIRGAYSILNKYAHLDISS